MDTINTGTFYVFTFKEGLLSAVAHDLRLSVRRFTVELSETTVNVTAEPDSLAVDGAMRDGRLNDGALRPKQAREILDNMHRKVLRTRKNPTISFHGRRDGMRVSGDLTMAGRTHGIELTVADLNGKFTGRVELKPTLWGIAPFSAMFGTIKLQDRLVIEFALPHG